MPIRVEIEGQGVVAEFPDGTDPAVIDAAVQRDYFGKKPMGLPSERGKFSINAGAMLKNVPANAGKWARGVKDLVTHPLETGKGLVDLASGATQKYLFEPLVGDLGGEQKAKYEAVEGAVVDTVSDPAKLSKWIEENPLDTAALMSGGTGMLAKGAQAGRLGRTASILQGVSEATNPIKVAGTVAKGVGKIVPKAVRGASNATSEIMGAETGKGAEYIRQAARAGTKAAETGEDTAFLEALRGRTGGSQVVRGIRDAYQKAAKSLGTETKTDYQWLGDQAVPIDKAPVVERVREALGRYAEGLQGDPMSPEVISQMGLGNDANAVIRAVRKLEAFNGDSPLAFDKLRREFRGLKKEIPKTNAGNSLIEAMEQAVKTEVESAVPGYREMLGRVGQRIEFLKDAGKELALRKAGISGRITADMTLRRALNTMKNDIFAQDAGHAADLGAETRIGMLRRVDELAGTDTQGAISGFSGRQWLPEGNFRGGGKGVAGVTAGILAFVNPALLPSVLLASPRVAGEFFYQLGKLRGYGNRFKNLSNKTIDAMKTSLAEDFAGTLDDAAAGEEETRRLAGPQERLALPPPQGKLPAPEAPPPDELFGRRLTPDQPLNGITERQGVGLLVNGKGEEAAKHVADGVKAGKITVQEAEDSLVNDAMKVVADAKQKGGPVAEGVAKRTAEGLEKFRKAIQEADRPFVPNPDELIGVDAGNIVRDSLGSIIGRTKSTAPKWFKNNPEGYTIPEARAILKKAMDGQPLTDKQRGFVERAVKENRGIFEQMPPVEMEAAQLKPGDSFARRGEKFRVVKENADGTLTIKDGITERLEPWDTIQADPGTFQESKPQTAVQKSRAKKGKK